jgi:hypothetical protein
MILISFSIALVAIVFGAKLLAQTQKDNLGVMYKYLSWFIIIMGFCVLLCDGARGMLGMARMGRNREVRREMMMRGGPGMMGGGPMCMRHCDGGNMNCCDNGEMNCCNNGGGNNCPDGMMNCHDGMGSSCKGAMDPNCPMMNGKCTMDSTKSKK